MNLCINQQGGPVRACQDALHSALKGDAQNAQNGVYGHGMASDVSLYRRKVLGVAPVANGLMLDDGTISALKKLMNQTNLDRMKSGVTGTPYDAIIFNQGDAGPPIGAMQNALRSALGPGRSLNAANGSYGSNTRADMETLGIDYHITAPCEGRGCSYVAWQLLLTFMNDANRANAGKPLSSDVKAMQKIFNKGVSGPPIQAMQAALRSVLGAKATNEANGAYGSKTAADLVTARGFFDLTPVGNGASVPKILWDTLYAYMNAENQAKARQPLDQPPAPAKGTGQDVANSALEAYNKLRNIWVYNQYRAMADSLWDEFAEDHSDCSSFATLCGEDANMPDPNERGYDGYGYTGSLWPCSSTCSPKAGALAFYGGSSGNDTTHVAVCISSTEVISFGSTPISRRSLHYRSDYRECRWPNSW